MESRHAAGNASLTTKDTKVSQRYTKEDLATDKALTTEGTEDHRVLL